MSYVNIDGVDIYIFDCGRVFAIPTKMISPQQLGEIMTFAYGALDL